VFLTARITGDVGTPYSVTYSVVGQPENIFEVESQIWDNGPTVSGTIQPGDNLIFTTLTGNVISKLTNFYGSNGQSTFNQACISLTSETYFHDGSLPLPQVSDRVYADSTGQPPLGPGYYGMISDDGQTFGWFKIISTTGEVALTGDCGEI
jgi:hypothetical protein